MRAPRANIESFDRLIPGLEEMEPKDHLRRSQLRPIPLHSNHNDLRQLIAPLSLKATRGWRGHPGIDACLLDIE